jgi:prolyl-tRNA synthetase
MRLSTLMGKTLREAPSEAHLASHQLLLRAGLVRALEPGTFGILPLGVLSLKRLETLARREMLAAGGQEVALPLLAEAPPHDALVRLAGREIDSYRQLPVLAFRFEPLAVPEPRIRLGLFGATQRPSLAVDVFHDAQAAAPGRPVDLALERILQACSVPVIWAEAGAAEQGAFLAHSAGDQDLAICGGCGYAALRSWAAPGWSEPPDETELPPEEVETPGCNTIAQLAAFLGIPTAQTLKMVFTSVEGRVTCVAIRGDRSVDEAKLTRMLGTSQYYPSLEEELGRIGAVGGYASPIGLDRSRVRIVADPSVRSARNLVGGANRPDYHVRNLNVPRDFQPGEWADLALVEAGDLCPRCASPLSMEPAFALASHSLPAPCRPAAEFLDQEGRSQPLWQSSWQLDLGRLWAAVVEQHHDEYGILWPPACAPLDVHLVALDLKKEAVAARAEEIYARLQAEGYAVLYDDRDASAGVKFNDADLIGLPLRLTISKRWEQDGLTEAKWRNGADRLKLDDGGLAVELTRLSEGNGGA